ncbi:hypothetical protein GCM10023346_00010 [Arthrobacter gyeryongensis]|uniref:Uncharacterized protein n=1 Tax=Arthrobacter gyeryongensis TaxID=1650592 RepID=A0ABP9RXF2_9MICC
MPSAGGCHGLFHVALISLSAQDQQPIRKGCLQIVQGRTLAVFKLQPDLVLQDSKGPPVADSPFRMPFTLTLVLKTVEKSDVVAPNFCAGTVRTNSTPTVPGLGKCVHVTEIPSRQALQM